MERQQNIRQASSRRIGANFDFNGNPIIQNDAGGVIRFSGAPRFYGCGHQAIPGVNICTCQL